MGKHNVEYKGEQFEVKAIYESVIEISNGKDYKYIEEDEMHHLKYSDGITSSCGKTKTNVSNPIQKIKSAAASVRSKPKKTKPAVPTHQSDETEIDWDYACQHHRGNANKRNRVDFG